MSSPGSPLYCGSNSIDALTRLSWTGTHDQSDAPSGTVFTEAAQAITAQALAAWGNLANIHFVAASDGDENLTFATVGLTDNDPSQVLASTTGGYTTNSVQVQMNQALFTSASALQPGSTNGGYTELLHDIGEALGLKATGIANGSEVAPFLPTADDHRGATVMSANDRPAGFDGLHPNKMPFDAHVAPIITPMLYDVAAIQYLYGANTTFHAGNDTYHFDGVTAFAKTLWDAGGTDTISAEGVTSAVTIDLSEGLYNYSHIGKEYIWAAYHANIENATGGAGADHLYGNTLANVLIGGAGNDTLMGGAGNDTLSGGAGSDVFLFNTAPNASSNIDTITDFVSRTDHIQLDKHIFTALGAGKALTAAQFYLGDAAHDASDRIIYNHTTGALYYDANGNAAGEQVQIAVVGVVSHPMLTFHDFILT